MLGSELKEIRLSLGLTQQKFAKILHIRQPVLCEMELGTIEVPFYIEDQLEKTVDKEYSTRLTDKRFSRELFLKDMLTGNEVVDDIYINCDWLNDIDGKKVYEKTIDITIENTRTKNRKVISKLCEYFIEEKKVFYCKPKWIK